MNLRGENPIIWNSEWARWHKSSRSVTRVGSQAVNCFIKKRIKGIRKGGGGGVTQCLQLPPPPPPPDRRQDSNNEYNNEK